MPDEDALHTAEETDAADDSATEASQDETLMLALQDLLNSHSRENRSGTPDYILAGVMFGALVNFELSARARDNWYALQPKLAGTVPAVTGSLS